MYDDYGRPLFQDLLSRAGTRKGRTRAQPAAPRFFQARRAGFGRGRSRLSPRRCKGRKASAFSNLDLPHTSIFIDDFGETLVCSSEHDQALGQM